ncbi:endonuclease/exonuclease/phosphatase family protein [Sphingobacterium sp. LRF_L2]|uniref:endonuclease/exonuclease/phosphatase family protein n=1 Tax=Sphingobacterium sp. LRF_L2 TaxID=3369421 RepID=UPI003F60A82E
MSVYLIRHNNKRNWGRGFVILLILCTYIYLTKTSKSASYGLHYNVAHNKAVAEIPAMQGEISLLTYNIAGLPELISAAPTPRKESITEISKRLNNFDIVNVQEDFHYHNELYQGGNNHPYRTVHKNGIPYGDGLNTFSKYPIIASSRLPWEDCAGSDCLAAKGFSFVRIQLSTEVSMDVYNVHATAQDNHDAAIARRKNFLQLSEYINRHSKNQPIVVMGDFNAHYAASWDNLRDFKYLTTLEDAWLIAVKGDVPAIKKAFVPQEKLSLTDSCESIDKIFFRNSSKIEFIPRSYKVEKQQFSNTSGQALSDHCAISLALQWRKKE